MATTNSTIEKIAPMFTDLLIKKIECLKTDWQKPWIASLEQLRPVPAARHHQTHAGALPPEEARDLLHD